MALAAACLLLLWHCVKLGDAGSLTNPFANQPFYVNPVNYLEYDNSIYSAQGTVEMNLMRMQRVPSAYWVDQKRKIRGNDTRTVEGILQDAASKFPPELVVLIWYDLPNRDCDAKSSNGEICCTRSPEGSCDYLAPGDCADGLLEYKTEYVDPFVEVVSRYANQVQIVLIMEPDGLANVATNKKDPRCGNEATQTAYIEGVKYALDELTHKAPLVAIYLDGAHGGWLGWENNLRKFMLMLKDMDLPLDHIRGFATNVANYQALGVQCPWCPDQTFRNAYCLNNRHGDDPCCKDPCGLLSQYNFGNNELNYAAGLAAAARQLLGMEAHMVIDTGRNGVTDQRSDCANWCNPRGAGAGIPSTTRTANPDLVDAYFWLKTPGESDGCSKVLENGEKCPRFDASCESDDSLGTAPDEPPAVEAGMWFDYQVKQLAENAVFDPPPSVRSHGSCSEPSGHLEKTPANGVHNKTEMLSNTTTTVTVVFCGEALQQCGGEGWLGSTCCQRGCSCVGIGVFFSQCMPEDPIASTCAAAATAPQYVRLRSTSSPPQTRSEDNSNAADSYDLSFQRVSTTGAYVPLAINGIFSPLTSLIGLGRSATPPPTPASLMPLTEECALPYGQCGGPNWIGPTCCDTYCSCQATGEKSYCVPKVRSSHQNPEASIIFKSEEKGRAPRSLQKSLEKSLQFVSSVSPWLVMVFCLMLVLVLVARGARGRPWGSYDSLEEREAHPDPEASNPASSANSGPSRPMLAAAGEDAEAQDMFSW